METAHPDYLKLTLKPEWFCRRRVREAPHGVSITVPVLDLLHLSRLKHKAINAEQEAGIFIYLTNYIIKLFAIFQS